MNVDEIFGKDHTPFNALDPFNNNWVEGFVSRQSTDLYGALLITKVNGDKVPQLIRCTPKLRYPFDRDQTHWLFPKAQRIERYEKLDGTNIFAYRYHDARGNEFVGWKTRLLPFVGNSRFGPFCDMLKEILTKNTGLQCLPFTIGMNISFELWGARNPHLLKYDVPLALSILFARNGDKILPPSGFDNRGIPTADLRGLVSKDYVWSYQEAQRELEQSLTDSGDGYYSGHEGEVWYILTVDGAWQLFKCKPESIELVHWSSGGISKNVIVATCENAFENWDAPTVENVVELLLEEFTQQEVEKVYYRIGKYLSEVVDKHLFAERVMADYSEIGVNLLEDKGGVMRALSSKYARGEMQKVYGVIWAHVAS